MKKTLLLCSTLALLAAGCASKDTRDGMGSDFVGNDKDAKGCLNSAGYRWCETTNRCERPWELSGQEGFENTEAAFNSYCDD